MLLLVALPPMLVSQIKYRMCAKLHKEKRSIVTTSTLQIFIHLPLTLIGFVQNLCISFQNIVVNYKSTIKAFLLRITQFRKKQTLKCSFLKIINLDFRQFSKLAAFCNFVPPFPKDDFNNSFIRCNI